MYYNDTGSTGNVPFSTSHMSLNLNMSPSLYTMGIFQICLFIFFVETFRATTSPAESEVANQVWIKKGCKTKLNIHPTFSRELRLPRETYHCPKLLGLSWLRLPREAYHCPKLPGWSWLSSQCLPTVNRFVGIIAVSPIQCKLQTHSRCANHRYQ